jgi:signal transduction histidine kinase
MNILTRLTLRFFLIVASIMILFSLAVYTLSAEYREEEFYGRLEKRALTTARLLLNVEEVNKDLLRIIDKYTVPALPQEEILVFDKYHHLVYCSVDTPAQKIGIDILNKIKKEERVRFFEGETEQFGVLYQQGNEEFIAVASAYDRYGLNKLRNLKMILISGLFVGSVIVVVAGHWFASRALSPLSRMNSRISKITAGNLSERIDEGNKKDEIARLAMNFNRMLQRLETAFETQQSFVSNASHELRTPLAVMRSQLQVILEKNRTPEEYRTVLQSLLDDTASFTQLTNGLLALAQSGVINPNTHFKPLRVDEVLFTAQEELASRKSGYHFQFDYETLPDNESALIVNGNEQLLNTAFTNFMDNSCKFSPDSAVHVALFSQQRQVEIRFKDRGIGIPESEREKIFFPFYRAVNAQNMARGHGIGLSLCKRIIELHGGSILVECPSDSGSVFKVILPLA